MSFRRSSLPLVLLTLLVGSATARESLCCPFCPAVEVTLSELVDQKDLVVLTKWISAEKPTDDGVGTTTYQVIDILKTPEGLIEKDTEITLVGHRAGKEGDLYLLLANQATTLNYDDPMEMTEARYAYVKNAPHPEVDRAKRLKYFLKYLEYPDEVISLDAFGEFAISPYADVRTVKDDLDRERIRTWLTDKDGDPTRTGLYGLLMGLCGNDSDRDMMWKMIDDESGDTEFRLGIEGVMSGYLTLAGEKGLEKLEARKIKPIYVTDDDGNFLLDDQGNKKKLRFAETYSALQAIRFMWSYEPDVIAKERLRESMRLLLDRPKVIDLVIIDLSRWEDWSVMDRLMKTYVDEDIATFSVRRQIIRYMLAAAKKAKAMRKDGQKLVEQGEESEDETITKQGRELIAEGEQLAKKAGANLEKLEQLDPKLYDDATRYPF